MSIRNRSVKTISRIIKKNVLMSIRNWSVKTISRIIKKNIVLMSITNRSVKDNF